VGEGREIRKAAQGAGGLAGLPNYVTTYRLPWTHYVVTQIAWKRPTIRPSGIALKHRGIDFAVDAEKVFSGITVTVADDRFDYGEVGRISAGFLDGRMVVIVWTERGTSCHIISMRYCHDKEEKRWHEILRQIPDR
jgi:uncharacterized DUF497 family protein